MARGWLLLGIVTMVVFTIGAVVIGPWVWSLMVAVVLVAYIAFMMFLANRSQPGE